MVIRSGKRTATFTQCGIGLAQGQSRSGACIGAAIGLLHITHAWCVGICVDALPEHTKVVVTTLQGEMLAAISKTGSLLSTVTESEDVALAPNESVMVATQVIPSVGVLLVAVSTKVEPVPSVAPLASSHV